MKPLKLCMVGAGRVAEHYYKVLPQFIEREELVVVAIVDVIEEKAMNLAQRFGATAYTGVDQLTEVEFDLAVVLTPSGTHEDCSMRLLSLGANVLCEKPIGLSVGKVEENIVFARSTDLQYGGVFQNRYNRAVNYTKKALDSGGLGKIISSSVRVHWCRFQDYYEDGWHGTWELDGGVVNQQAIHHIDALFYLLGEPSKVTSFYGRRVNMLEAEDTYVGCGELRDGSFYTLEATTAARPVDLEASISILGESGFIKIGGIAINEIEQAIIKGVEVGDDEKSSNSVEVENGYGDGHYHMFREILDSWASSGKVILPLNAHESLKTVKYIHAFYSAAESSTQIDINTNPKSKYLGVKSG